MTTKRQDYWAKAATQANAEGNIAGVLFGLLAQPSEAERGAVQPRTFCPKSQERSTRHPGVDQCEECGRMVRTRQDGTYSKHFVPVRRT